MSFKVIVAENSHYMDESENYAYGTYDTLEQAVAVAKEIVDRFVIQTCKPGVSFESAWSIYAMFGEDPYIRVVDGNVEQGSLAFSARSYARERCMELCNAA